MINIITLTCRYSSQYGKFGSFRRDLGCARIKSQVCSVHKRYCALQVCNCSNLFKGTFFEKAGLSSMTYIKVDISTLTFVFFYSFHFNFIKKYIGHAQPRPFSDCGLATPWTTPYVRCAAIFRKKFIGCAIAELSILVQFTGIKTKVTSSILYEKESLPSINK